MSYKDRNRKIIELPSGATVLIRKMVARDYLGNREIPILDLVGKTKPSRPEEITPEKLQQGIALAKIALVNCTSCFSFGSETFKIVDKVSADCGANELAIEDLDQEDADAIVTQVNEFSGWTTQAAEAAKPFPAESPNGAPRTQAGAPVPLLPDATTESVPR